MVISSGKYSIIEAGNALTFDEDANLVIEISAATNFKFRIIFEFQENGNERQIERVVDEKNNVIKYRCINFQEGAGTAEAFEIGQVGGKKMYLHFWVEKVAANKYIRSIQYTVYKEN